MNLEGNFKILTLIKLILVFLLFPFTSTAQNNIGMVLDVKSHIPLAGVNIFLKSSGTGTTTNEKGEFYLDFFSKTNKNDTLFFSIIGYNTSKVTYSKLQENEFVVFLSEEIQNLEEVTITSNKLLNKQIQYKKLASLKVGIHSFGSLLIDSKIYVIGGDESYEEGRGMRSISFSGNNLIMKPSFSWQNYSDKLYEYDIKTDTWTTSSLKFGKRAYHNINYFKDKIYILGGKRLSTNRKREYLEANIEVYDIMRDTILIDKINPHQAANIASFIYQDNLIVIGGSTKLKLNEEKECSSKVHLLNLKTGYWYELNDMPIAKETKGILIKNIVYLIGGFNVKPLTEIESYDLTTGEWKIEGTLFYGVERPGIAFNKNIIYIFEEGKLQTYNIETKELNMYSIDLPLKSCELFYAENKLYLLGGLQENESSISPSNNLYSIDLNEFNKTEVYNK